MEPLLRLLKQNRESKGRYPQKILSGKKLSCAKILRGHYKGSYHLIFSSPLRLWWCELALDQSVDLYIPPEPKEEPAPKIPGTSRNSHAFRENPHSLELLESREYHPGDDPRRIHWKQAARTGKLFLRIDQGGVPRSERIHCLLDLPATPLQRELLLSHFSGLLQTLKQNQQEMEIYLPGRKTPLPQEPEKIQKALAEITGGEGLPPIPPEGPLLVYGPENHREQWASRLQGRNWIYRSAPKNPPRPFRWRNLLFREGSW